MRSLKSILKILWGIWGAVGFAVTIVLFIPFYYLIFSLNIGGEKGSPKLAHKITRVASELLFTLLLLRVKTKGKELLDPKQVYIFVSNHRSLLDIPACAISTHHTFRYLAKSELTKIPLFGYIIRKLYITVSRKDKEDRERSMNAMFQSLRDDRVSIFIYPEGTRNKTSEPLKELYDGAFRLALETGYPIAVLAIRNSGKLLSGNQLSPGIIECIWNAPISVNPEKDTIEFLKEKVRKVLLHHLMAE